MEFRNPSLRQVDTHIILSFSVVFFFFSRARLVWVRARSRCLQYYYYFLYDSGGQPGSSAKLSWLIVIQRQLRTSQWWCQLHGTKWSFYCFPRQASDWNRMKKKKLWSSHVVSPVHVSNVIRNSLFSQFVYYFCCCLNFQPWQSTRYMCTKAKCVFSFFFLGFFLSTKVIIIFWLLHTTWNNAPNTMISHVSQCILSFYFILLDLSFAENKIG